ncbi:hypothetical protein G9A89_003425 [Geosiphon pyriformis]|nr:hypothetical protein G9A89_003425 [Geosiphon pyriformis]
MAYLFSFIAELNIKPTLTWQSSIIFLTLLYTTIFYFKYFTRKNPLPGPFPIPLIGNLPLMVNLVENATYLAKKYGDIFEIYVGSERHIFVNRGTKQFLAGIADENKDTSYFHRLKLDTVGILMNRNIQNWRRTRNFLANFLQSKSFIESLVQEIQSQLDDATNIFIHESSEIKINFGEWATSLSTDLTLKLATGRRYYSMITYYASLNFSSDISRNRGETSKIEIKNSDQFIQLNKLFPRMMMYIMTVPLWIREYFPGFSFLNKRYWHYLELLDTELDDIINSRGVEVKQENFDLGIEKNWVADNLVTFWLTPKKNFINDGDSVIGKKELKSLILELIAGGIDKPANQLCFIIYQLAKHPEFKSRLIFEINSVFKKDPTRKLTYSDLESLPFTKAIIKESLRLTPAAPLVPKISSSTNVIGTQKQFHIFENQKVWLNLTGINQNRHDWKEPENFNPERFLEEEKGKLNGGGYLPFGAGVRKCPGEELAIVELMVWVVSLYRRFDVEILGVTETKGNLKCKYKGVNHVVDLNGYLKPNI